jgi:hypothetical protein
MSSLRASYEMRKNFETPSRLHASYEMHPFLTKAVFESVLNAAHYFVEHELSRRCLAASMHSIANLQARHDDIKKLICPALLAL